MSHFIKALIPAKGSSSRIPRKNLQELWGQPLFTWAIDKCRRWIPGAEIYVASDDNEIRSIAAAAGCSLYDLIEDDVKDRRSVRGLFQEFVAVSLHLKPATGLRVKIGH